MIQTGDSTTRHAKPGEEVGLHSPDTPFLQKSCFPKYFHKRGALAAAREPDDVNPEHASSGQSVYIVYGRRFSEDMIDAAQARLDKSTGGKVVLTPELRESYFKIGGTPHLDGQYRLLAKWSKVLMW